jgi:hypothetical protein
MKDDTTEGRQAKSRSGSYGTFTLKLKRFLLISQLYLKSMIRKILAVF